MPAIAWEIIGAVYLVSIVVVVILPPSKMRDRLLWPDWYLHTRDLLNLESEASRRQLAEWDAELEYFRKHEAPPSEQGKDPFIQ